MAAPEQPDNSDPYDLGRFLAAQQDTYANALAEIRAGRKRSHWMWFVFPQIQGLGSSENARFYAISNADEARAYLTHPVLGPRLLEITEALLGVEGKTAHDIFGSPDDMKLFASMSPPSSVFEQILARFFSGERDPETIRRLV